MGSEKEALKAQDAKAGDAPAYESTEAPPLYHDIDGAKGEHDDGGVTDEKPPLYNDEKKPIKRVDSKPETTPQKKRTINQDLKIPYLAEYLIGKYPFPSNFNGPAFRVPDELNPDIFAFELVCLVCFEYESECACVATKPVTVIHTKDIPSFKTSLTTVPYTSYLAKELGSGRNGIRLAAAVAQATWPAMNVGMVPIFNPMSLVVIRSRAMDKATRSRELLEKIGCEIKERPDLAAKLCKCCRKDICTKITSKYNIKEGSEEYKACTETAYYINKRVYVFTRLGHLIDGEALTIVDMIDEPEYLPIRTADEQDFLFYCSILPYSTFKPRKTVPKDPRQLSWDKMVVSLLSEILTGVSGKYWRLQSIHSYYLATPGAALTRATLRAEGFGAGAGFMIMEIPIRPPHLNDRMSSYISALDTSYREDMNDLVAPADGFVSKNSAAQPVMRDCKLPQPPGAGWTGLSLDKGPSTNSYQKKPGECLRLNYSTGMLFGSKKQDLGQPSWARKGWTCTGKCLKSGPVLAAHAGFTPPDTKTKTDTTVYRLGDDPMPWIMVNQYAAGRPDSLYIVDYRQCLACTVLLAPKGSIIGAGLPRNGSLMPGVEPHGITGNLEYY